MTTRDEAIQTAAKAFAQGVRLLYEGTPREAAERAYNPGGPPVEELEARIRAHRAGSTGQATDPKAGAA